jgi:uncharacterized protein YqgC (DUF456 family)
MKALALPIIFSILLAPGMFLVFVPFFPALSYMLVVALSFAVITGFVLLLPFQFAILAIITIASLCVDWSAGALGAKYGGAHAKSIGFGILGMLAGTFLLPPFGGIIGLFVAIFISEKILQKKTKQESVKAAGGALLGTVAGMIANAVLAVSFFVTFIVFVFF